LDKKKQRAIERAVKGVDRELERTDKAFERASSQLDAITQKHEDKMAFEREYSRLIEEGSTPAAAQQAIELQKQLLELDRSFEKQEQLLKQQVQSVELSIEKAKAEGATTAQLQAQLDRLKEIEAEINKLPSKKGKAEGAIKESLAPETGRDKIEAEMERVQGALNDLLDPANQVILAANAIGDAFSESFKGLITGSMSAQEALANLFSRTADHFADMAAQMIAKAIQMKILGIALNFFNGAAAGGGASSVPSSAYGDMSVAGPSFFQGGMVPGFAEGGYVSGPTRAIVGEGGQGEYVIPESKMRESMARYSRGARGSSVIPGTGGSGTSGESGGTAVAAPIDVRFTVERINSVDYVTADQFQAGMRRAADEGAKQGEQKTLKRLQMSSGTRKRLGM
jgi:CRISPR/Cas system CSM-associated protein Csm2 small subunit